MARLGKEQVAQEIFGQEVAEILNALSLHPIPDGVRHFTFRFSWKR